MAKIRASQTFTHAGELIARGAEIEVDDATARVYVRDGKAVPAGGKAKAGKSRPVDPADDMTRDGG